MKPGIHDRIPMDRYVADDLGLPAPSASAGVLHTIFGRAPAHAHAEHPRLGGEPDEPNTRADIGSAAHALILGGGDVVAIQADDWRSKAAREAREAARLDGKIPVLEKWRKPLYAMVESCRPLLDELGRGPTEQTMIWQDGSTWCRARADMIAAAKYLIDIKTATNADPASWIKSTLRQAGYDMSAAHYLSGYQTITGEVRDYVFLVVEIEPPYAASLVGVGPSLIDLARRKYRRALGLWQRSLDAGRWPGYRTAIHWAEATAWDEMDAAERLT